MSTAFEYKNNPRLSFSSIIATCILLLVSGCSEVEPQQTEQNLADVIAENEHVTFTSKISDSQFTQTQLAQLPANWSAHWLTSNILVLPKDVNVFSYHLLHKTTTENQSIALTPAKLPEHLATKYPHLANFEAYHVTLPTHMIKQWLKSSLMVVKSTQSLNNENKQTLQAAQLAYVQIGAVIDDLYTTSQNDANEVVDLGATINRKGSKVNVSFKLWAPTAQSVAVHLYDANLKSINEQPLVLVEDTNTGVWQLTTDDVSYAYYKYQVEVYHPISQKIETLMVTDPYSLSLSVNSQFSQVVDLNDTKTQPSGWLEQVTPVVKHVEDNVFYETHIRDFSANDASLSNPAFRGKYKAFSEKNSTAINHLKSLQKAGLNNIHLLPTFDIATVNEDSSARLSLDDSLEKLCTIVENAAICQQNYDGQQSIEALLQTYNVTGQDAQALVSDIRQVDNYNWGYDPFHYTVPEGSYAMDANGVPRIVEFREMVRNLHDLGFRVIMDVVYNHTYQAGLAEKSVLDKIVPQYYHRLHPITGKVEQSTCCDNTATERVMMGKLMTDSLVVWARDYKIDGFRFDLMGHQPKDLMLASREAVRRVDNDTYFYGEGWNFGEVASNSQFIQASQLELGGSEIGTFTDRLRDAVRGGGNNTRDSQGIGNGLLTYANDKQHDNEAMIADYNLRMDQLRVGLAGNLVNFPLRNVDNKLILGKDIPYGDQPTGYALDPADTINYVSKHDNQTLWDNSQYRLAYSVTTEERVRMHVQSLSFALFAQGIPFIHMGSEFMRSKSFLRDSYDYGDWFNRVDFSKQDNFYNVGLPPAEKDQGNWPLIKRVLAGHKGLDHVDAEHIKQSSNAFTDLLAVRMSSPLFRLTDQDSIISKVSFLNSVHLTRNNSSSHQPGLLVMHIDDSKGTAVDSQYQGIVVIFNTSGKAQTFDSELLNTDDFQLHPLQQQGTDIKVKQSYVAAKGFTVPALTSAVFVAPRK